MGPADWFNACECAYYRHEPKSATPVLLAALGAELVAGSPGILSAFWLFRLLAETRNV